MHSPESTQALAHRRDASGPPPIRTMSSTPAITSRGAVMSTLAGSVIGHASTHLPHLVHASAMASARWRSAVSKAALIVDPCLIASAVGARLAGRWAGWQSLPRWAEARYSHLWSRLSGVRTV